MSVFLTIGDYLRTVLGPVFNKVVTALIVLFIGFIVGKLAGKFIEKLLHEVDLNNLFNRITGATLRIESTIGTIVTYLIYFITVVMALDQLGIQTQILTILSLAILAVVVLSIFLSIKDIVPNFIAGVVIHSKKLFSVGDRIMFRKTKGKVIHLSMTETRIETKQGDVIYVPNQLLTQEEFVVMKQKG